MLHCIYVYNINNSSLIIQKIYVWHIIGGQFHEYSENLATGIYYSCDWMLLEKTQNLTAI